MPEPRPPLIVVAGATAGGKTALAIELAERLAAEGIAAEIISGDSRQVYRGMDIGTAKVTAAERARVPHHGLDLVDPDQPFSVSDFAEHVTPVLARLAENGGVAILAGGTGFYLRAIARDLAVDELPYDAEVRASVELALITNGLPALVAEMRSLAPTRAAEIDLHNPRRVVRALEIARIRGDVPLPQPRGYGRPVLWLGLAVESSVLRDRIRARARGQFEAGLIEETRALIARFDATQFSFSGIGYAEARAVIDGRLSYEEAVAEDAARNVRFARRQDTWFRREPDINWLNATGHLPVAEALELVHEYLAGPTGVSSPT